MSYNLPFGGVQNRIKVGDCVRYFVWEEFVSLQV